MKRDTFTELSHVLTGESDLDPRLAEDYEQRLRHYFGRDLDRLLEAFEEKKRSSSADVEQTARAALADVPEFHRVAREIIRVWYTGQFKTPYEDVEPPREVEHYSQGLLWRVIGTHAPGFTNAAYGAWEDPPRKGMSKAE